MQQRVGAFRAVQPAHQVEHGAVRAEEEMLTVVDADAVEHHGAGAPAEHGRLLVHRDRDARVGQRCSGCATGPSAADDGDAPA